MTTSTKQYIFSLLALVCVIGLIFGLQYVVRLDFMSASFLPLGKEGKIKAYAADIIAICAKETHAPTCYDKEIPKLMDTGVPMEDAFEVTKYIQDETKGYYFCHVLGHNVAAKETAKDPAKWTGVIARCPTGMCSNGCLHGAAQERFRSESLTPEQIEEVLPQISSICEQGHERNFTGLEQASCYHAMGHLMMYITNADIDASLKLCNRIAIKGKENFSRVCYDGAYMQIFQPLEPEDFTIVKDIAPTTRAGAEAFCKNYKGEQYASCHGETWPLYRESLSTGPGIAAFCEVAGDAMAVSRCYMGMEYVMTAQLNFDVARITPLCESMPKNRMGQCFGSAASRSIETDYRLAPKAVELCEVAQKHGVGERCYKEILFYSSFNYHKGSKEFGELCNALPEPWKQQCNTGEGTQTMPTDDS